MKKIVWVAVTTLAVLVIAPFLIPTDTYLRKIENAMSGKLQQPVAIGSMRFALLPSPRARLGGLRVGKNGEISISEVTAVPALGSLFSEVMVISTIRIDEAVIQKSALDLITALPSSETPDAPAAVEIRRIELTKAQLAWPDIQFAPMNAEMQLAAGNKLQSVSFADADNKLKGQLLPEGAGYAITLDADHWTAPAGPKLVFDQLHSEMRLQGSRLNISSLAARLYQGRLDGTAQMDWGKGLNAAGKFGTEGIAIEQVAQLFSKQKLISGKLSGNGTLQLSSKDAARAADNLVVDYRFSVAHGVLHGVDLAKAATLLLNTGEKGGETQFDALTGTLHVTGKRLELRSFKVVSGLLAANGNVKVSPTRKLDGVVDVELKKGVALATVPLQVSGTLDQPSVMPTKAALAGAAIGTGVLGPGVGTSLGVKAASGVEKIKGLFGN